MAERKSNGGRDQGQLDGRNEENPGPQGPTPMGGGGRRGRDQCEIGGKICQEVATPLPAHFLRF